MTIKNLLFKIFIVSLSFSATTLIATHFTNDSEANINEVNSDKTNYLFNLVSNIRQYKYEDCLYYRQKVNFNSEKVVATNKNTVVNSYFSSDNASLNFFSNSGFNANIFNYKIDNSVVDASISFPFNNLFNGDSNLKNTYDLTLNNYSNVAIPYLLSFSNSMSYNSLTKITDSNKTISVNWIAINLKNDVLVLSSVKEFTSSEGGDKDVENKNELVAGLISKNKSSNEILSSLTSDISNIVDSDSSPYELLLENANKNKDSFENLYSFESTSAKSSTVDSGDISNSNNYTEYGNNEKNLKTLNENQYNTIVYNINLKYLFPNGNFASAIPYYVADGAQGVDLTVNQQFVVNYQKDDSFISANYALNLTNPTQYNFANGDPTTYSVSNSVKFNLILFFWIFLAISFLALIVLICLIIYYNKVNLLEILRYRKKTSEEK